jgi:hypothetical protein
MEYRIKVQAEKTEDFLQLLRTWKRLGIIEDYLLMKPDFLSSGDADFHAQFVFAEGGTEVDVSQYRDLVD